MIPNWGRSGYPIRSGRGKGYPLIQYRRNLLIAENIASQPSSSNLPKPGDPLYSTFQELKKIKG